MEFAELNPAQREAVENLSDNILLLAPGYGQDEYAGLPHRQHTGGRAGRAGGDSLPDFHEQGVP